MSFKFWVSSEAITGTSGFAANSSAGPQFDLYGVRAMKARESAVRVKRFEADEYSRKVANLELMIRDFHAMAADLDRQIQAEEERTGVKDSAHFAYSTFAKSAAQRRNNLRGSEPSRYNHSNP